MIDPDNQATTPAEFNSLHKVIYFLKKTIDYPLTFVPLDLTTVTLVLISDALFDNAKDLRSQIDYVIALVDAKGHYNIIHYG